MIGNKSAFESKNLFKGPYENFQIGTNGNITLQMVAVMTRVNIHHINTYKKNIEEENTFI